MRVEQLGEGTPELAIVGGVHGDEACGVRAIERLIEDDPEVLRPVKLVVANERALDAGVRYVNTDLNRAFTDSVPEDVYERELAQELDDEVEGCTVLSIHSTQSHAEPFAITSGLNSTVEAIVPHLSVKALVDATALENGRLFAADATIIEVEAGLQGTETADENAYSLAREFLTATGALPGDTVEHDLPLFEIGEAIPKPAADDYDVFVENFERVDAGERFAAADGTDLIADEPFWPVLVSPYGYRDQFGYRGQRTGVLGQSSEGANSTSVSSRSSAQ
ncbi:succinylglutamate desuccinylase/aspartoacylase domain-containing protein [Halobacterium wangiae]|uniref:succinylglutamate desuccinylase/aspartoacylase domain-containing protein n=1 Tax=Halobacterium wangiae TaxID=2902623 RepID=UPI001E45B40D|nr:succinylglutamate desuccinylase/aspartoacylase family protein [Halobacterium wangiae]